MSTRVIALLLLSMFTGGARAATEIREFDLSTIEKLGRELSRRDEIAGRAQDLVMAQFPEAKSLPLRGWITELNEGSDTVYLIMEKEAGVVLAYSVTFPSRGSPAAMDRRGEALPASVALRDKARRAAFAVLQGRTYATAYNYEVLEDPAGRGFLVYGLAATRSPQEMITGGHFRVMISANGATVEKVDALSRGILRHPVASPDGAKTAALFTTQADGRYPFETFIYSSALYHLPIYVSTKDGTTWKVAEGAITKMESATPVPLGQSASKP